MNLTYEIYDGDDLHNNPERPRLAASPLSRQRQRCPPRPKKASTCGSGGGSIAQVGKRAHTQGGKMGARGQG
jgi:hypothetical protein